MTGAARFPLGQLAITSNASLRLTTEEVLTALRRHASGDWGDLCPEDTQANDMRWSMEAGSFLLTATVNTVSGSSPKRTIPSQPCCFRKIFDHATSPASLIRLILPFSLPAPPCL